MLFKPAPARCPVCGAPHADCGPRGIGHPIELTQTSLEGLAPMAELKPYTDSAGNTFFLTDEDAQMRALPIDEEYGAVIPVGVNAATDGTDGPLKPQRAAATPAPAAKPIQRQ